MVKTLFETGSVAFDGRVHARTSLTPFHFMFGEKPRRKKTNKKKKRYNFRIFCQYCSTNATCHEIMTAPFISDDEREIRPLGAVWLRDDETERPSYVNLHNHDSTCTLCKWGLSVKQGSAGHRRLGIMRALCLFLSLTVSENMIQWVHKKLRPTQTVFLQ